MRTSGTTRQSPTSVFVAEVAIGGQGLFVSFQMGLTPAFSFAFARNQCFIEFERPCTAIGIVAIQGGGCPTHALLLAPRTLLGNFHAGRFGIHIPAELFDINADRGCELCTMSFESQPDTKIRASR